MTDLNSDWAAFEIFELGEPAAARLAQCSRELREQRLTALCDFFRLVLRIATGMPVSSSLASRDLVTLRDFLKAQNQRITVTWTTFGARIVKDELTVVVYELFDIE